MRKLGVVLLFFIVTAFALFYAFGFRFDPDSSTVVETGIVRLTGFDSDIEVFFNSEKVADYLPVDLQRVNPGKYDVVIKKDGFHDWVKTIEVLSGQITDVPSALMVPSETEERMFFISRLPSDDLRVFEGGDFIGYYLRNRGIVAFFELANDKTVSSEHFDLGFKNELVVYPLSSGRMLVKLGENVLAYFSRVNPEINEQFVLSKGLKNLRVVDFGGYYLRDRMLFSFVLPAPFSVGEQRQIVGERILSDIDGFEIVDASRGVFVVKGNENNILGRFEDENFKPLDSGLSFVFDYDEISRKLIYMKGGELWLYDFLNDEKKFITRFSGNVSDLRWYVDGHHFFFVESDVLQVCSIDMQNCFFLKKVKENTDLILLEDENYLIFETDKGLYGFDYEN